VLLIYWQAIDINGGVEEDRTLDLHVANVALSQLSYDPTKILKDLYAAPWWGCQAQPF
jgi:YggT family protein